MVRSSQRLAAVNPKKISIREFARRDGCSDTLVRKAIQSGYLTAEADGKLNARLVGTGWRRSNIDDTKIPDDPNSKADASRRIAISTAKLLQLRLDRELASLAPVDELAEMVAAEYATVRARLRQIPAEVAEKAAVMRSPVEVQALLAGAINAALHDLSAELS